ncbi:MAG: DUF134 domain-containing protein [Candidatus Sumerlaeota bacterium]|nr:DUF134 domain-containing protein [Candidatus Sumerlaeota bacterium]
MPRPVCCRRISEMPGCRLFKPAGVPAVRLQRVALSLDELEAIRLADREGMYQEDAALRMSVSRQTFGRIVESARRKVALALTAGHALQIQGGEVEMCKDRSFTCSSCKHVWEAPHRTGRPTECPSCKSGDVHRSPEDRGKGGACGRGQSRHRGGSRHGQCCCQRSGKE